MHVVPTASALKFVGLPTWEAISHNPVTDNLFENVAEVRHVALGQSADLIVVAPATANSIVKIAAGFADDLLGTTLLASDASVLIAPAMHTEMWNNTATQHNVQILRERGLHLVGPNAGALTGADVGIGRMAEPEEIFDAAMRLLAASTDLAGARVLISAGGTQEPLDPVRFLGNHSSGKQGIALASAARARGAQVSLVLGAHDSDVPAGIEVVSALTAAEMRDAMLRLMPESDVVVMAAAVADFRPVEQATEKLRKAELGAEFELKLIANPDILAEIVSSRSESQVIVGFAAETGADDDEVLAHGRAKLARKGCDLLVVNRVGVAPGEQADRVFGADTNAVQILERGSMTVHDVSGAKLSVAHAILDDVVTLLEHRES